MLTYRSSMLTFLHTTWPNIMFLTCLDLCSPPKRHLDLMSASSLRSGLALLEAFGPDGQPVYSVYSHVDHEDQPDEEGAYSVFVLNATTAHDKPLEKNRVCMASMVGVGSLAPLTHIHTHTHTQPPNHPTLQVKRYVASLKEDIVKTVLKKNAVVDAETFCLSVCHPHCTPPPTHNIVQVQTLHRVQVLCKDEDLTKHNFNTMMRCDCKAYWRVVGCCHVDACAHWCGHKHDTSAATHVRDGPGISLRVIPSNYWTWTRYARYSIPRQNQAGKGRQQHAFKGSPLRTHPWTICRCCCAQARCCCS